MHQTIKITAVIGALATLSIIIPYAANGSLPDVRGINPTARGRVSGSLAPLGPIASQELAGELERFRLGQVTVTSRELATSTYAPNAKTKQTRLDQSAAVSTNSLAVSPKVIAETKPVRVSALAIAPGNLPDSLHAPDELEQSNISIPVAQPIKRYTPLDNPDSATRRSKNFDMRAAAPIEFIDLSRELAEGTHGVNAGIPVGPAVEPLAFAVESKNLKAKSAWPSFGVRLAMVPLPSTRPQANTNKGVKAEATAKSHVALYSPPESLDTNVDRISFDTPTLAPMAFMRFCIRYSADCAVHQTDSQPNPVELTKERRAELVRVNRDVNRAIRPQENLNGVEAEEWLVAPREGDCNDYAVTKRHKLLALGWPSRSLLLAEVVISSGEHHLILIVRTRQDDLILDNLNRNVRPISQIDYQWVRAQEPKNPRFWAKISVTRGTRVAMNGR